VRLAASRRDPGFRALAAAAAAATVPPNAASHGCIISV
jgi:hypothetical protein